MQMTSRSPLSEASLLYDDRGKVVAQKHVWQPWNRRRLLHLLCAFVVTASLSVLFFYGGWTSMASRTVEEPEMSENISFLPLKPAHPVRPAHPVNIKPVQPPNPVQPPDPVDSPKPLDALHPLKFLNGPPTTTFRENLRNDTKYITSFLSAGWTNDVMTYGNLIYLALITERIPILAKFVPSHVGDAEHISFGKVFDLPRLRQSLRIPVLEWDDVKDEKSEKYEGLGCWSVWLAVQYNEDHPRQNWQTPRLKLDISYTAAPPSIKMIPGFAHDLHASFWALAALSFPESRNSDFPTPRPSELQQHSLEPDEQLLCYDYLYYVGAHQFEFEADYSPAWRFVGRYMRWTPELEALADQYVRKTIGVADDKPTPPYIGVHIRHGDFLGWCNGVPAEDCFASVPVIARRVHEVQQELRTRKGIEAPRVIMTSDEKDPAFWAEVQAQGWLRVDHSKTAKYYGRWYPVFIDAVIQSGGEGFVGTDRSTMSLIARRRVESWRDGATRTVKWGTPDADDH